MINNTGQLFSILGDPGAVSLEHAIFSDESLLLDVNFRSKLKYRADLPLGLGGPFSYTAGSKQRAVVKPIEPTV